MTDTSNGKPSEHLSESLVDQVDALDQAELRALRTYVTRRINSIQPSLEEQIRADAAGEVLEITDHSGYVLVKMHPPSPDGPGVDQTVVSLYHVQQEPQINGTVSLHWTYIDDAESPDLPRCDTCGGVIESAESPCPHCEEGEDSGTDQT